MYMNLAFLAEYKEFLDHLATTGGTAPWVTASSVHHVLCYNLNWNMEHINF